MQISLRQFSVWILDWNRIAALVRWDYTRVVHFGGCIWYVCGFNMLQHVSACFFQSNEFKRLRAWECSRVAAVSNHWEDKPRTYRTVMNSHEFEVIESAQIERHEVLRTEVGHFSLKMNTLSFFVAWMSTWISLESGRPPVPVQGVICHPWRGPRVWIWTQPAGTSHRRHVTSKKRWNPKLGTLQVHEKDA